MKQKEIKTRKELMKLHDELVQDLHEAVNYSEGVKVWSEDGTEPHIKIMDTGSITRIMTGAIVESIMEVLQHYEVRYQFSISFYLDIQDERPIFVIRVSKYVKD